MSSVRVGSDKVVIRSYDRERDRERIGKLERNCDVGPKKSPFFKTDALGDPLFRIRNSPTYEMLVILPLAKISLLRSSYSYS